MRHIPNMTSITFWERTTGAVPKPFTFGVYDSRLTTRLNNPLNSSNNDFFGVRGREFYDVFYSDADGSFNLDGEFVTVEGVYNLSLPFGGALNLAEVQLNFDDGSTEFASFVSNFIALGDNKSPGTVKNAVDGNLLTHTTMGNTIGQTQRLRVTVGFNCDSRYVAPDEKLGCDCDDPTCVDIKSSSVNITNGNLFDSYEISPDKRLPLTLSYNSRSTRTSRFGPGWNDSLDIRLISGSGGAMTLINPNGREDVFTRNI